MVQTQRTPETHSAAIHRLAERAVDKGITIHCYPLTGEHFATSASTPGLLHRVTIVSCDCEGFIRHGRCTHHSALLAELGELPKESPCPRCDGTGTITYPVRITPDGTTVYAECACGACT